VRSFHTIHKKKCNVGGKGCQKKSTTISLLMLHNIQKVAELSLTQSLIL